MLQGGGVFGLVGALQGNPPVDGFTLQVKVAAGDLQRGGGIVVQPQGDQGLFAAMQAQVVTPTCQLAIPTAQGFAQGLPAGVIEATHRGGLAQQHRIGGWQWLQHGQRLGGFAGAQQQVDDLLPRQVVLDGKRLQQVLLNLLSNAAKFTRDGVVTLSVTAEPEGDACILRVAVSDTGVGIDLSQGVDIFGAFQRIQAAGSSTGLGLFIAQRLVSAMGGSLSVASVSGQGSTFSFVLSAPVIDASGSGWTVAAPRETEPRGPSRQPTASGNVLLDDPALDELAGLALHGRLTDIERWIDRHADEAAHAPFLAQLRELLEQFDFAAIHALALGGQSKASDRGPAAPHE